MSKRLLYLLLIISVSIVSCKPEEAEVEPIPEPEPEPPVELVISADNLNSWADLSLKTIKESPENSPTYASRSLGYLGLTAYESVVQGSIEFKSISSSLNGLTGLPIKVDSLEYNWELTLNSAYKEVLLSLYPHAPERIKQEIDTLHSDIQLELSENLETAIVERSNAFGLEIAQAIIAWAEKDGGHRGFERTFDFTYSLPRGEQFWVPPAQGQTSIRAPMTPYWGQNRTFLKANEELPIPGFLEFSKTEGSDYFNQMSELYLIQKNLTQTAKENAIWWGDDPTESVSPPGHSYYLASVLVKQENLTLFEAASTYAKVGISLADAFINCWKCKFHFHSERPTFYIRRNIDPFFITFWPEPPFPAFTSGHSTQAAAAAVSLASVFGNEITFTDSLHVGRPRDSFRRVDFVPRTFNSLWAMAEECGYSRLEGGIHIKADNESGLAEGRKIAENVVALPWRVNNAQ